MQMQSAPTCSQSPELRISPSLSSHLVSFLSIIPTSLSLSLTLYILFILAPIITFVSLFNLTLSSSIYYPFSRLISDSRKRTLVRWAKRFGPFSFFASPTGVKFSLLITPFSGINFSSQFYFLPSIQSIKNIHLAFKF